VSRSIRGRFNRRDLLGAARVGIVATLLVAITYAAVVALLDFVVADHLTGQVDRQLASRLQLAVTNPTKAFASSGVQTSGARYGLGIYGEPIALWAFTPGGELSQAAPGDPLLEATTRPPATGDAASLNYGIAGTTYRLQWLRTRTRWLLAGESLSELGHVEAVLITSEAVALPFLFVAFFLVAFVIGLRSARPIEVARQRQLEFTADASHELRTPLSVIEAEVSLARSQPRAAGDYEATLDRVAGESQRLRRIVEDLLWLARVDAEPALPAREAVDLREVARSCTGRFAAVAASRNQHLEIDSGDPTAVPLRVLAPADWLDRLAGTLIDNACRHCPEGARIRVSAGFAPGSSRPALRVEDDGPGIAETDRIEILHRFKRGTTNGGGHGLGLAIADSVVRRTGGLLAIGASELGGTLVEASWPKSAGS
jgi:two-component system sensor histidine kinase CiaH